MTWLPIAARNTAVRDAPWRPYPNAAMTIEDARRAHDEGRAEMMQRRTGPARFELCVYLRKTPHRYRAPYFSHRPDKHGR